MAGFLAIARLEQASPPRRAGHARSLTWLTRVGRSGRARPTLMAARASVVGVGISRTAVDRSIKRHTSTHGIEPGEAAMVVMTVSVMAVAHALPDHLEPALLLACRRWCLLDPEAGPLEPSRIEGWEYLDSKYGNSTTIADPTDRAVRALICVLHDDQPSDDDLSDTLDFFIEMADGLPGLSQLFGELEGQ
jgi:hypothetical protein